MVAHRVHKVPLLDRVDIQDLIPELDPKAHKDIKVTNQQDLVDTQAQLGDQVQLIQLQDTLVIKVLGAHKVLKETQVTQIQDLKVLKVTKVVFQVTLDLQDHKVAKEVKVVGEDKALQVLQVEALKVLRDLVDTQVIKVVLKEVGEAKELEAHKELLVVQ